MVRYFVEPRCHFVVGEMDRSCAAIRVVAQQVEPSTEKVVWEETLDQEWLGEIAALRMDAELTVMGPFQSRAPAEPMDANEG